MTDWLGIVGCVAGVAGAGIGGLGVWLAARSNRYGKESRNIARKGSVDAVTAIGLARKSNVIAEDARNLAAEANTISLRSEDRDIERHDVHWELERESPGVYTLTNLGTDEALSVRATVEVGEWKSIETADLVPGGECLTFSIPEAEAEFRRELAELVREREERRRQRRNSQSLGFGGSVFGYVDVSSPTRFHHWHSYRVDWQTPKGKYKNADDDQFDTLGDHPD